MKYYYMDKQTGELFTKAEMLKHGAENYDLGDPTNAATYADYYEKTDIVDNT